MKICRQIDFLFQIQIRFVFSIFSDTFPFHLKNVMSNIPIEQIPPVRLNQQRPPTADGDTMERLFQALFYRIAVLYARAIPKHIRRLGETVLLVLVEINRRFY
jgi:hypothetical protein